MDGCVDVDYYNYPINLSGPSVYHPPGSGLDPNTWFHRNLPGPTGSDGSFTFPNAANEAVYNTFGVGQGKYSSLEYELTMVTPDISGNVGFAHNRAFLTLGLEFGIQGANQITKIGRNLGGFPQPTIELFSGGFPWVPEEAKIRTLFTWDSQWGDALIPIRIQQWVDDVQYIDQAFNDRIPCFARSWFVSEPVGSGLADYSSVVDWTMALS